MHLFSKQLQWKLPVLLLLVCLAAWGSFEFFRPLKEPVYNGRSYDDDIVADMITVIIPTSPFKSMPSTSFLHESQASLFRSSVLAKCRKIIVFDGIPPKDLAKQKDYDEYKKNVLQLTKTDPYFQNTDLVMCEQWGHLSGAITEALKHVKTPYVFIHQHDLKLIKDIDVNGVIATMEDNPNVKHVAFPGDTDNIVLWTLWNGPIDTVVEGVHYVPLRRTFGWTDRSHIAHRDYYTDFILPKCNHCFMEFTILPMLKNSINTIGLDEGHRPYGTYFFGEMDDGDYIIHTDARVN